jgi:hypothetical protein
VYQLEIERPRTANRGPEAGDGGVTPETPSWSEPFMNLN